MLVTKVGGEPGGQRVSLKSVPTSPRPSCRQATLAAWVSPGGTQSQMVPQSVPTRIWKRMGRKSEAGGRDAWDLWLLSDQLCYSMGMCGVKHIARMHASWHALQTGFPAPATMQRRCKIKSSQGLFRAVGPPSLTSKLPFDGPVPFTRRMSSICLPSHQSTAGQP